MEFSKNSTLHLPVYNNKGKMTLHQFKVVLGLIIVVFFIFICLFVYNLIKCYLPIFSNNVETMRKSEETDNKIEFV